MKKSLFFLLLILFNLVSFGQKDSTIKHTDYSFILQDSPSQLFTMRQFNQSYLSSYRLFTRSLYGITIRDENVDLIQLVLQSIFLMPLTHEEGHRSILTELNIGSISQPYFNKQGAAYVKGVSDQTLQNLRNNDFPNFIRLHSGGLESDYMLTKRMESIGSFNKDQFRYYRWEYWMRKATILQYYVTGLFKFEINLKEEENELDRDIVGYDTYGAARHLFRPNMDFYRYTRYDELTNEEIKFVKRMGFRSLLNLLNPLILGRENFKLTENTRFNVGMGYTMSPFGDFIDENIWIKHKDLNFGFYARQFQTKENWFNGLGISLNDYQIINRLVTTATIHFWQQPKSFDFNTSESFSGGAIDLDFRYFFFNKQQTWMNGFSLDLGMIYKTKGFLPEELNLDKHFGLRIGTTIRI